MKVNVNYTILFLLMTCFSFAACEKKNETTDCSGFTEVKVIRVDCDEVVFQVMSDVLIGDPSWTDARDGQVYHNVVRYRNTCRIAEKTNGYSNKTLFVKWKKLNEPGPLDANCVECDAISPNPPQQWVDFTEFASQACKWLE